MRNGEEATTLCVSVLPPPFQGSINEGNRLNFEKHIQDLTTCHCKKLFHIISPVPWIFEQIARSENSMVVSQTDKDKLKKISFSLTLSLKFLELSVKSHDKQ